MKKILVIIDAQNDFIDGALVNPAAQAKVPNIVKLINDFDGDYIFTTQDTHTRDYLNTKEGKNLPVPHCEQGTEGWRINNSIKDAIKAKENVKWKKVIKPTFGSITLASEIKGVIKGEEAEITIVGFCTDICVVSNAMLLKANFYENAEITVDASCCASVYLNEQDEAERQAAALKTMKACQINVVNE